MRYLHFSTKIGFGKSIPNAHSAESCHGGVDYLDYQEHFHGNIYCLLQSPLLVCIVKFINYLQCRCVDSAIHSHFALNSPLQILIMATGMRELLGVPPSTASTSDSVLLIIDAQNE
jgi:hypothetical protein